MTFSHRSLCLCGVFAVVFLLGCDKVDYQPVLPDTATLTVNHMGAYSSQMGDDENEVQGTLFQTRWKLYWRKEGDGWVVQRRLDTLEGKGYHKYSMPNELEKKADLDMELGPDGIPRRITGYDSLYSLLGRLPQGEDYRRQLLGMSDTVRFQAAQRDVFRLRNLLPRGVLKTGASLDVGEINRRLETLQLDSAGYQGERPRMDRECLEYEAYYHRTDSLPLLVEQFFFSSSKHRKWKHASWDPGRVDGVWHFSAERKTGLPCFESLAETGHIVLKDSTQKDGEQPITLYRYEEDLYSR